MERGLMLTVSQVVISIMILQSMVLINVNGNRYLVELETVEKIKNFEMFSYNIMFDLCINLKKWAPELAVGQDLGMMEAKLKDWTARMKCIFKDEGNLELKIEDLRVEEYKGQPCDSVQMAFIGKENLYGKYISGTLFVDFEWLFVKLHKDFRICISV